MDGVAVHISDGCHNVIAIGVRAAFYCMVVSRSRYREAAFDGDCDNREHNYYDRRVCVRIDLALGDLAGALSKGATIT